RAAQQRPDAGEQLVEVERLDHVVVRAGVEPGDAVLDRVARGQHQDRYVGGAGAQPTADLDAVEPGQHHVEHDQVGQPIARRGERVRSVLGGLDLVALEAEPPSEHRQDPRVVVDDEQARPRGRGRHLYGFPGAALRGQWYATRAR